jgi:hypothetical protein
MNPVMDATKATHHGQTVVQDPGQQLRCSCNPGFQLPPCRPKSSAAQRQPRRMAALQRYASGALIRGASEHETVRPWTLGSGGCK